jgi:uncharacterized membrane protein
MAKKKTGKIKRKKQAKKEQDKTLFAFLATFLSIIGFLIAVIAKKDDKYVMFYAKQSLVIFITSIIAYIIGMILVWIPILGWIIYIGLNGLIVVLWIISWIFALSGEQKDVPIIGDFAKRINL